MEVELLEAFEELPQELRPPLLKVVRAIQRTIGESVRRDDFLELKAVVADLAEAQRRTEERLNQLAGCVDQLAEAQRRTEEEIKKLASGLRRVRREVGGLSRSVAYALENEAFRHLPSFLQERHGLEVMDRIVRAEIEGEEINVFARVRRDGQEVYLVGEVVLRLDDRAKLRQVWKKVEVVKEHYGGEVVPILVTHFARKDLLELAEKAGIIVVQSFEW